MNERLILEALQKQVTAQAAAITPVLPVKYLGRVFEVPDDNKYWEIVYIPNNVLNETWDDSKTYRGIFRIILHWPINDEGFYEPMDAVSAMSNGFLKGQVLQNGNAKVRIYENPELSGALEQPPKALFPMTIRYYSF